MYKPACQLYSPDHSSLTSLKRLVKSIPGVKHPVASDCLRKYLDTYDWQLLDSGYLLELDTSDTRRLLRLRQLCLDPVVLEQPVSIIPHFIWEIPPGKIRDKLKKWLNEKALMEKTVARIKSISYKLTDADTKNPLTLTINSAHPPDHHTYNRPLAAWIEFHSLHKQRKSSISCRNSLIKKYHFKCCNDEFVHSLLSGLDDIPREKLTKKIISFDRGMPGQRVMATLLNHNLNIMETNEVGMLQDIDTEYLHDFRVGNRRSRSLITQVKRIFPETDIRRFSNDFSWLSRITSRHRDLDVFLGELTQKIEASENNTDIRPVIELLRRERDQEHTRLLQLLESTRYEKFKRDWRNYLDKCQEKTRQAACARTSIIKPANQNIWKNYQKLIKKGKVTRKNYSFESIHELRKTAKKLRYLMEAFRSLYGEDDIDTVIGNLKKLQNNLGMIVDMHIQRDMLEYCKQQVLNSRQVRLKTIKAIDRLEDQCIEEEISAAKKFNLRFDQFSKPSTRKLFQKLFH